MARIAILLLLTAAVTGCASASTVDEPAVEASGESLVDTDRAARVLYHALIGEFAGKRDDLARAASAYAEAARLSEQPAVAARAARLALYAGDLELAERGAQRWLTLAPDAAEAKRMRGLLALRSGKIDMAREWFVKSLPEGRDGRESALSRIGGLLAQQSDQVAALKVAAAIAKALPDSRMAPFVEAQVALRAGQAEQALAAVDRALAVDEGWRAAQVLRVKAMLEQGRTEPALGALRKLLDERPDDFALRLQYAQTLTSASRFDAALAQFERLIERKPQESRTLIGGGALALQLDELDKAEQWFARLLDSGKRENAARYYLGRIAEQRERYAEAIDYYSAAGGRYRTDSALRIAYTLAAQDRLAESRRRLQALRADRPSVAVRAWVSEAEILRQQQRLQASLEVLDKALKAHPEDTDLLYGRAMTQVARDRIEAAEADFRAVLEREPDNAHALNALGYTLADRTQRLDEAAKLVEQAYSLRPDDAAIIDSMGWVAYRQGRLEDAVSYLRKAYERSPQGEIAAHLGEVLWQLGLQQEARDIWQRAAASFPESDVLQRTMRRFR